VKQVSVGVLAQVVGEIVQRKWRGASRQVHSGDGGAATRCTDSGSSPVTRSSNWKSSGSRARTALARAQALHGCGSVGATSRPLDLDERFSHERTHQGASVVVVELVTSKIAPPAVRNLDAPSFLNVVQFLAPGGPGAVPTTRQCLEPVRRKNSG